MAEHVDAPGTAPVVDRRPVPRGVLPRGVQTWLMAALAVGMLLIIFLTGRPEAPPTGRQSAVSPQAPNARPELRGTSGARHERSLFPVSSRPLFGAGFGRDALFPTPPPARPPPTWLLCACAGT